MARMDTLQQTEIAVQRTDSPMAEKDRAAIMANPGFGKYLTDHMVTIRYTHDKGWHDARVSPLQDLGLSPGTMVLHYAGEIFEGMKAYRLPDGGVTLFRPGANASRFNASAERLAMAQIPEDMFVSAVRALVHADQDWVPPQDGASLYLRPFMIGTEMAIGTHPSNSFLFSVIASPVASYFKGDAAGVSLWVSENYTRAAPGGTGAAKCGGNYAGALAAQAEAAREGCEQVVFLDAVERRWVEELAGMNIFFVFEDGSLQTPPLSGTILPGITRNSLIALAHDMGMTVREERYGIDQWKADAASGRLVEVFACGTAAVVAPIGTVKGKGYDLTVNGGEPGPVTAKLKKALTDIQFGRAPDPRGWLERVV